ncbi:cation transporter [Aminicella lysinilytica]|uniref:Heavy-metal-associated domain-containing protein n=1 Tax=Aminicella lysinilytica TaxID=433323 RepID=A0A4R6Q3C0_9FIRM|nr:cation transporter [Aminicella lysinilytica]TDP56322.1 heavy-metal-associated domain-containing protein [Aminicella lysinilytica]
MKKSYKLENLDCANCAAKMERAIGKIDGVNECSISFMTQKINIDAEDEKFDDVMVAAQKAITKVDRGCKIIK